MTPPPMDRTPRTAVRWAVTQGIPSLVLARAARQGDLLGRLLRVTDDPSADGVAEPPSMLVVDPPDHTPPAAGQPRVHPLVSRAFTPWSTARFEPTIEVTFTRAPPSIETV